jgi:addiction module HigA family antidote
MKNAPHMGGFIRREILKPLSLSVTDAAAALDVTRQALSNLVNEKAALTADMALRLEKAFGVNMELMLRMQLAYDVAQTRARERTIKVRRYKAVGT